LVHGSSENHDLTPIHSIRGKDAASGYIIGCKFSPVLERSNSPRVRQQALAR
jgi:hypothetical protein